MLSWTSIIKLINTIKTKTAFTQSYIRPFPFPNEHFLGKPFTKATILPHSVRTHATGDVGSVQKHRHKNKVITFNTQSTHETLFTSSSLIFAGWREPVEGWRGCLLCPSLVVPFATEAGFFCTWPREEASTGTTKKTK